MNERCHFCGNKNFKEEAVQYIYRRGERFLIVNNVPCEQCEFCGEQYYSGEVLSRIEDEFNLIYEKGKKIEKALVVPVEQFSELHSPTSL